jgi:hypothetical protein
MSSRTFRPFYPESGACCGLTLMAPLGAVRILVILENWCDAATDKRRTFWVEKTDIDPAKPWNASVALGPTVVECTGRTMSDALAQLSQVVLSDPGLELG